MAGAQCAQRIAGDQGGLGERNEHPCQSLLAGRFALRPRGEIKLKARARGRCSWVCGNTGIDAQTANQCHVKRCFLGHQGKDRQRRLDWQLTSFPEHGTATCEEGRGMAGGRPNEAPFCIEQRLIADLSSGLDGLQQSRCCCAQCAASACNRRAGWASSGGCRADARMTMPQQPAKPHSRDVVQAGIDT
ncbi:hypothetical protein EJ04DRAFT_368559 [Polyplosphaeria fusca]|uniref:Uncharacterized protein n=1 Tax=Polyplosphaeria fusca TaxID=682080 RepID=A0A9P4UZU6_9PLEO|nr:hypothetical protein EJ04DRAFT_368559 [Polyplosphaeria fusca]